MLPSHMRECEYTRKYRGRVAIPLKKTTTRTKSKNRRKSHVSKKIAKVVKMELPGGEAKPGPKLASAGVNMAKFCTDFNAKTADRRGEIVPVLITAFEDKSYACAKERTKHRIEATAAGI